MVVILDKNATNDLKNFFENSKISPVNLKNYISDLLAYIKKLENYPNIGKIQYIYNETEIRQLVFKMHKIFYYIKEDKIIITAIFHTHVDINRITKYLKGLSY